MEPKVKIVYQGKKNDNTFEVALKKEPKDSLINYNKPILEVAKKVE